MGKIEKIIDETISFTVFCVIVGNELRAEFNVAGCMIKGRQIEAKGYNWRDVCHNADLGAEVLVLDQIIGTTCVRDCLILDAIICRQQSNSIVTATGLLYQLPQICQEVYGVRPEIILYRPKEVDEKNVHGLEQKLFPFIINGYQNLPGTDCYYWIADC